MTDLIVEYRAIGDPTTRMWCVVRYREIVATDPLLDTALETARRIAHTDECAEWLVTGAERIKISPLMHHH